MLMRVLLPIVALLAAATYSTSGAVRYVERGVTADGRVVVWSRPDSGPPWGRDIIVHPLPRFPKSVREKGAVGTTLVRVVVDAPTGKVREVILESSSGHPDIDASVVTAVRKWQLRPNRWREFQIHVTLGPSEKLPPYKAG